MNIAVKSTTEQRAGYVFASLTVHLAGMTLGDKNAEDLCGTVTAGLQTVTHNIRGLIRDPHATLRWEQAKKHPLEESPAQFTTCCQEEPTYSTAILCSSSVTAPHSQPCASLTIIRRRFFLISRWKHMWNA